VVADIAKLTVGREEYYTRELATDHESYLSGHGESPGRWYGAGARGLGLEGEASVAEFEAMFEGRHPTTGELLGRPHGRNAVPAFDVVLRPTKSVSGLYGLGDPATGRAVLAAHHTGLAEAAGYLDEHLGARRGHGGHEHVSGQGLLAVGFDHRTSRAGDPLLHTHLVIANRVQGPDGRWTALDGRDLYRHRLAADAIYRATYQRELVRTLGVEWAPADSHGNRELLGMPEGLVRGFSKRTGQIDAELERLVADGRERTPRLVKWTVQATRKPKQHETPDTLYGRWRQEAAARGVDPDTLVRTVTGRTANRVQDRTVSGEAVDRLLDRLGGPEGLTERASTFTRPDVLVALGAGLAGARRAVLEELADRFLAERAVSVVADRTLEERRWSTPELLSVEQRLVQSVTCRTGEQAAVASHQAVRDALAAHPTAGADQQAMVRDLCQGGQGVALVVGRAGTGKTFALGIARHAWQLGGYRLLAAAPTGIATMSLQGEGFEDVATCDRLLADLDCGQETLDSRTVLVVDEAGMLGSRKLARLLEHADHAQAKVVLVGDDRQLAAIDAGVASAPSGSASAPASWSRTAGNTRPGNAKPLTSSGAGWSRRRWPPTRPTIGWWPPTPSPPPPWPCCRTGGRPGSRPTTTQPKRWWCWPPAGPRWIGSTPPARNSWPPTVASAPSGSRSRTASFGSGTGRCAVTTLLPSWGWPTAAAAPSPPSTPKPEPSPCGWTAPTAARLSCPGPIWTAAAAAAASATAGSTWPMSPPGTAPRD
jgi:conjugative relaxase-like TrwC/TraI family protein